jgi:hypothetical protein
MTSQHQRRNNNKAQRWDSLPGPVCQQPDKNSPSRESFRVGLRVPLFGEDWREVFPFVKMGGR